MTDLKCRLCRRAVPDCSCELDPETLPAQARANAQLAPRDPVERRRPLLRPRYGPR